MINKFFLEYGKQKAAWNHEREIVQQTSTKLSVLSKHEEILQTRILRTYLAKRRSDDGQSQSQSHGEYKFDVDTLRQHLMMHDAILPSIMTQNDRGDFVLLFETDNQLIAFQEAFSNGLDILGSTVYFASVRRFELGNAMKAIKALLSRRKREKRKKSTAYIEQLFPRNMDDEANLGGLLQTRHVCSIPMKHILHTDWSQESLIAFAVKPAVHPQNDDNDEDNETMMHAYYSHLESVNTEIWKWYFHAIPNEKYMNKIRLLLDVYLVSMIRRTLRLSSVKCTEFDRMVSIFGSLSYGLFIRGYSDIDIGVNLNVLSSSSQHGHGHGKKKAVKFLQMLSNKLKKNSSNVFDKIYRILDRMETAKRIRDAKQAKEEDEEKEEEEEDEEDEDEEVEQQKRKHKGKGKGKRKRRDVFIEEERFAARVPIIKCKVPHLKLSIDICINNESNLVSKLIMMYVKYDARVRPFLCAIKYWTKRRSICDAFRGYLNSFAWILLAIHFLQRGLQLAVLPVMKLDVQSGCVLLHNNDNNDDKDKEKQNEDTVAELLSSFFQYYANFDFHRYQISITNGNGNGNEQKRANEKFSGKAHEKVWLIEHPLKCEVNVASAVKKWTAHLMKEELRVASECILSGDWRTLTEQRRDQTQTLHADEKYQHRCLLLSNLRYDASKTDIEMFVSRIAKPVSVVMSSYSSGRHVGKCYVALESPQIAHNVMAELNGNLLFGRAVFISFAPLHSIDADMNMDDDQKMKPIRFSRKLKLIGGHARNDHHDANHSEKQQHEQSHDSHDLILLD